MKKQENKKPVELTKETFWKYINTKHKFHCLGNHKQHEYFINKVYESYKSWK